MSTGTTRSWTSSALAHAAVAAAALPLYFSILRTALFNTTPRDDYAPYLLFLVGQGGGVPNSPFGYRVLSVAAAVPFFHVLPDVRFSQAPAAPAEYLQATQALMFVSYLALTSAAVVTFHVYRRRVRDSLVEASLAALLCFLCCTLYGFAAGVDPVAVLMIGLLVLALDRRWVFAVAVVVSAGVNEKIPLLFAAVFLVRLVVHIARRRSLAAYGSAIQTVAAVVSLLGYLAARAVLALPGFERQTDPAAFLGAGLDTLRETASARGLVLNLLPIAVVVCLAVVAARAPRKAGVFRPQHCDLSGVVALVGVSAIADVGLNVGRIVVYAVPLFVPWAVAAAVDLARDRAPGIPDRKPMTCSGEEASTVDRDGEVTSRPSGTTI